MEQGNKVLLWKSSFASVGFLQNPLSLFLTFLNKYNSFHCRLEKWNSHRTNDRFFGQRKAKAFVKSSVYFADRLMTSKRSRSLFFTAWKTSFRPPTTLEQKRKKKSSLHPSLQLQISWPWKSKEIVNLCTEKSVSHVTEQTSGFQDF